MVSRRLTKLILAILIDVVIISAINADPLLFANPTPIPPTPVVHPTPIINPTPIVHTAPIASLRPIANPTPITNPPPIVNPAPITKPTVVANSTTIANPPPNPDNLSHSENLSQISNAAPLTLEDPVIAASGITATRTHLQLADGSKVPIVSVSNNANKQIWNLKNADITAVIQAISAVTGRNFIIDPRVSGKITLVSHTPMGPDEIYQVFLSLLQVLNLAAVPEGDVIKIVPAQTVPGYATPIADHRHPGMGDEVVARVVQVNNVSATQLVPAIRPLLQPWGSITAYAPSNSLILVDTAANLSRIVRIIHQMDNPNRTVIRVMRLRYASATKLVEILQSLQATARAQGEVSNVALAADSENNTILISANLENQAIMHALIRKLDTPGTGDNSDTIVIHLNYLDAAKLAPILTRIVGGTVTQETLVADNKTAPAILTPMASTVTNTVTNTTEPNVPSGVTIQAVPADNALILHGPRDHLMTLRHVIARLDVRPREVLVQAIIVRVDQSTLFQLGVEWGSFDAGGQFFDGQATVDVSPKFGLMKNTTISAIIHFLQNDKSSDVLATPSIMVLNNTKATIDDGKNLGILNRQYSTNVADNNETVPFNTFERKDVTLSLKVTPTISPNQMLRMNIEQEDNTVDMAETTQQDNPVFRTSKLTTNVLVRSGDILVLGGLMNNTADRSLQSVPILGDIPLLGELFKYRNNSLEKQDLLVFIRPIIVNTDFMARKVTDLPYAYGRSREIVSRNGDPLKLDQFPVMPTLSPMGQPEMDLPPPQTTIRNQRQLMAPPPEETVIASPPPAAVMQGPPPPGVVPFPGPSESSLPPS